jgi:hypothetical protein
MDVNEEKKKMQYWTRTDTIKIVIEISPEGSRTR